MDVATISAVVALVVAALAFVVAFAQALQQYFITGQLIRLCDSVVFGDLPGQGHRIWQMSQLRFRVVYEIPQIGIAPELWPSSATASLARKDTSLSNLMGSETPAAGFASPLLPTTTEDPPQQRSWFVRRWQTQMRHKTYVGEASWASFVRTVHPSCHRSTFLSSRHGDADRCPAELPTVPMPVSLRDTVVMALMTGMECTAASFDRGSVSMQGPAGTITSAQHPILGPLIHFSPRNSDVRHAIGRHGVITKEWLWRVMDNCIVAGRHYNSKGRREVERDIGVFYVSSGKTGAHHGRTLVPVRKMGDGARSMEHQRSAAQNHPSEQHSRHHSPPSGPQPDDSDHIAVPEPPQRPIGADGPWILAPAMTRSPANHPYGPSISVGPAQPDFISFKACQHRHRSSETVSDTEEFVMERKIIRRRHRRARSESSSSRSHSSSRRSRSSSRSGSEDSTTASESKYPKKGKTRIPARLVSVRVLIDLGYPFVHRDNFIIVRKALSQKQIDEILELSEDFMKESSSSNLHPGAESFRSRKPTMAADHVYEEESPEDSEDPEDGRESEDGRKSEGRIYTLSTVSGRPSGSEWPTDPAVSTAPMPFEEVRGEGAQQDPTQQVKDNDCGPDSASSATVSVESLHGAKSRNGVELESGSNHLKVADNRVQLYVGAPRETRNEGEGERQKVDRSDGVHSQREPTHPASQQGLRRRRTQPFLTQSRHRRISDTDAAEMRTPGVSRHQSASPRQRSASPPNQKSRIPFDGFPHNTAPYNEDSSRQARLAREDELFERQVELNRTSAHLGNINWFWLSQTDILPGFWATPWRSFEKLNHRICSGAKNVLVEAILSVAGPAGLIYSKYPPAPESYMSHNLRGTVEWLNAGRSTHPAYAYNGRSGIVCGGVFTSFFMPEPIFPAAIPAVELLHTSPAAEHAESLSTKAQRDVERRLIELMRLDAWLSIVGRTSEIRDGPSALLVQAPALVQALMSSGLELYLLNADESSLEGGAQLNKDTAQILLDNLEDNELTRAEALYMLVAVLRTIKVGECVLTGPDTALLADILEKDVQVSLV